MPYTMQDYRRDVAKSYINQLTIEERLEGLDSEEILKRFSAEEVLKQFSAEEVLKQFPVEAVQAYLDKLRKPQTPNS